MPVFESEAIILRQYALSDADRIIVAVTRDHGKLRAAAQGVKRPKSRLAGCLEPSNHVYLEYWCREGKDLCQIHAAELIHSFLGKSSDFRQICLFSYFAELTNELVSEDQANPAIFRLLLSAQHAARVLPVRTALIRYFEVWSLKLSGLLPNYAYCSSCGKCVKDVGFFAWPESGQSRCPACAQGRGLPVRAQAAAALEEIIKSPPNEFAARSLDAGAEEDLEHFCQRHLSLHLEKQMKSYKILQDAFQGE